MPWKHECSLDWLKKRQHYLTASEIKKLLPITATGRPRKITDEDRLKILSHKVVKLTEADCVSYGAAARGHIMEPYAVKSLNDYLQRRGKSTIFHWWDDEVIGSIVAGSHLGFSPDAADVEQGYGFGDVHQIAEIKSYSDEQHMLRLHSKTKTTLEERWQIATAMAARPKIEEAYLVFFNPRVMTGLMRCDQMGVFHYERSELLSEINMIYEIDEAWTDFLERYRVSIHPCDWDYTCYTEEDIYNRYLAEAGVNP